MRTVSCPNCGATAALSIESVDAHTCVACKQSFALSPEMQRSLADGRAALARAAEADRQLDERERKSVADAGVANRWTGAWIAATLVPPALLGLGWGALTLGQERPSWSLFVFGLIPIAFSGALVVAARGAMARARYALLEACAADLPAGPSQPACCYVCGASIAASTEPVARCRYCRADNVVDPAIVAKAHAHRDRARVESAEVIAARLRTLREEAKRRATYATGAVVAGPVLALVAMMATSAALSSRRVGLHGEQFAVVQGEHGACIAKVTQYSGRVRLSYGALRTRAPEDRPSASGLALQPASAWVGRSVRVGASARTVTIRAAFGTMNGSDYVELDDGTESDLAGLCLVE
ncbi:MAG: hypothetical protein JNK05_08865 [Myxococcales bacterium]|nr:hypothetical protein [Myxococcales bacterium]